MTGKIFKKKHTLNSTMRPGTILAEGKTKIIYANADNPETVLMYFKDDITAGDGEKHDEFKSSGEVNWRINRDIFELLNQREIATHYLASHGRRYCEVRKLEQKINLEIVVRRVAAGSYLKRYPETKEGCWFSEPDVEFFYKDDALNDPKVDEKHLELLLKKNPIYGKAMADGKKVFLTLEQAFAAQGYQLIDLKIEEGFVRSKKEELPQQVVIDDITAGSLRLWPYRGSTFEPAANVFEQLDKEGMLDKQLYRDGKSQKAIMAGFRKMAEITGKFKDIP